MTIDDCESLNNFEIGQSFKETFDMVEESSLPPKTKSIQDIYQRTHQINYALSTLR